MPGAASTVAVPGAGTERASQLATLAVDALIDEAELTPKPALVDGRGGGSHDDMDLDLLRDSALALRSTFVALAERASGRLPGQSLREDLACIGRRGEQDMFAATNGVNTHRGAIWALGLLVAAASCVPPPGATPTRTARMAGRIATFPDLKALPELSHGGMVQRRYGVAGAREEACRGFPNVVRVGLPALHSARRSGSEAHARLDALVAMIACVDDTCLLYRGGPRALAEAQVGARVVQDAGGVGTRAGGRALLALEERLLRSGASPGGSADLLAAVLFLDALDRSHASGRTTAHWEVV